MGLSKDDAEKYRNIAAVLDLKAEYEEEIERVERLGNESVFINIKHDLFMKNIKLEKDLYIMILKSTVSDFNKVLDSYKGKLFE